MIEREATIVNQEGLHARPAAKIVRLASTFDAEIELARAKLDQLRAYVELYRALGGGWSDQEIRQVIDAARSK